MILVYRTLYLLGFVHFPEDQPEKTKVEVSGGHLGGQGEVLPPPFLKTIAFCCKTVEMCDVILPKQ